MSGPVSMLRWLSAMSLLTGCAAEPAAMARETGPPGARAEVGPGVISTAMKHESPAALTAAGRRLYFTRAELDFSGALIYYSDRTADGWTRPQQAAFSRGPYDAGAALTPDGRAVIFTSSRPTDDPQSPDDWNLWLASVSDGEAAPLPAPINSEHAECCAALASDRVMYFSSDRAGSWDIYRAVTSDEAGWHVTRLGEAVNSAHDEWPSYIGAGERLLLFSSIRPDGLGGDDIYVALRQGERWRPARLLAAPVNTAAYEDSAIVSDDGAELWFAGRGDAGVAVIYRIDARALSLTPGSPDR